jgi:predicted kinase
MRVRYPRTTHLPWSPGASSDDVRAVDLAGLEGQEVVVTEKLDGENTTLYRDGLHARSLDSAHHPSRAWLKALHARIASRIPDGLRVCGENVFARHSIAYDSLESFFYAFSVWDRGDRCLDWDATERLARALGAPLPPVLFRGRMAERTLRGLKLDLARQEGYVVRTVAGFPREEFPRRVAKWVRKGHVQTDEHWMLAPVVPNGLGPRACLWDVRAGATPDVAALRAVLGLAGDGGVGDDEPAALDAAARLAISGRTGDTLLAGVLAALLHTSRRASLMTRLPAAVGTSVARRVGDLVGLQARLQHAYSDERRPVGLRRMARAVDVGALHAVALATLVGRADDEARQAREQVALSELFAADAGLLEGDELAAVRACLREALVDRGVDVLDRCFAEAASAWVEGRLRSSEEAVAATWRFRDGAFPRVTVMVGPSGSGKSTFVEAHAGDATVVSLDALRAARGGRADQSANGEVLRAGLERLGSHLAAGERVVWDATSLTQQQRALPAALGARYDALVTFAVLLVPEEVVRSRNARRQHGVPEDVLSAQLGRFSPPFAGEAHRTLYVDEAGAIADVADELHYDRL